MRRILKLPKQTVVHFCQIQTPSSNLQNNNLGVTFFFFFFEKNKIPSSHPKLLMIVQKSNNICKNHT